MGLFWRQREPNLSRETDAQFAASTTAAIIALAAAGTTASASVYSANRQANAAENVAGRQARSAAMAAGIQTKDNAFALDYQKQKDAQDQANFDQTQRANYDLERARTQRANVVRGMLGLPTIDMPDYVPTSGGRSTAGASSSSAGLPSINPSNGDLGSQISSYFRSRGVSDTETPYWVQKWPELVARGQQLGDPNYANKRLAQADIFGGGVPTGNQQPNSFASLMGGNGTQSPFLSAQMKDLPYLPPGGNSIGAYMG